MELELEPFCGMLGTVIERRESDPRESGENCPLCADRGIQIWGEVSGLQFEIACDCARGRRNSNLCVLINPHGKKGTGAHDRRANVGGASRNRGQERAVHCQEVVLASLEY